MVAPEVLSIGEWNHCPKSTRESIASYGAIRRVIFPRLCFRLYYVLANKSSDISEVRSGYYSGLREYLYCDARAQQYIILSRNYERKMALNPG